MVAGLEGLGYIGCCLLGHGPWDFLQTSYPHNNSAALLSSLDLAEIGTLDLAESWTSQASVAPRESKQMIKGDVSLIILVKGPSRNLRGVFLTSRGLEFLCKPSEPVSKAPTASPNKVR